MSAGVIKEFKSAIKVAGRAVEYWGSQSISSDASALFELVKNSRDADAKKVEILFENVTTPSGRITVKDDGTGMTEDEIKEKWLVAGTDFKIINPKTKAGRRVWGEMGIGRFSCERLAKKTKMISYPRDKNEKIVMDFDWEEYKKPGITFEKVEHQGFVTKKEESDQHGLELILDDLRSKWSEQKIQRIKKELGSYILPKELKGPDDFEIVIKAPEFHLKEEKVESAITKIAPIQVRAEFDGTKTKVKIYDVDEDAKGWRERTPITYKDGDEKTCGPIKFGLFFFPLDKSGESKWASYYNDRLRDMDVREGFLKKYAGIYLYRDAAWMKPYGGSNDWLGLEGRRVQRRSKVGNSQVYGIVHTNQETNPRIRPTAHREVLQDNEAFHDLKKVLIDVITELESYRDEKKAAVVKTTVQPDVMAENNISLLTKLCKSKDELTKTDIGKILQYATATGKFIQEFVQDEEEKIKDIGELRQHELSVLTVGLVASYVAHQITEPLDKNIAILNDAQKMMDSLDFSKPMSEETVNQGREWLEESQRNTQKITHFMAWVDEFSHHISKSVSSGGKTKQVKLQELWDFVVGGLKNTMDLLEIKPYYYEQPENLKIRISAIDLESVISNLMINSIDALQQRTEGSRVVRFDAAYKEEGLVIKFSDNGPGINLKNPEEVFVPFVTTHRTGDEITHGHGLGLPVVKEILRRYNGTIEVSPTSHFKPGATFLIKFPSSTVKRVV